MFSILIFCQITLGFITHDHGYCKDFFLAFVSNFPCANGYSKTSTIQFSGTFANPPQIILILEALDQSSGTSENYFSTKSVTTTSFSVLVKCLSGRIVSKGVHWYAIDDLRIEVINRFDTIDFTTQVIPHQNPNAIIGFVSLFSISYSGKINFNINIVSITHTDVTVEITDPESVLGNLKQISYQIILAVPEAINKFDSLSLQTSYQSPQIPDIPNTFFLVATSGYYYLKTDNIRLEVKFQPATPIKYTLSNWGGYFVPNTHTPVQLFYQFTNIYKLLKCDQVRISQYYILDQCMVSYQPLSIKIKEISKTFSQIGTFQEIIDKSISQLNFIISLSCELNKKIKSQFFMYQSNLGVYQMKTQYHYCGGYNKIITYYIRFIQQTVAYQDLTISKTDSSCSLQQIVFNQVKTSEILFNYEVIDV